MFGDFGKIPEVDHEAEELRKQRLADLKSKIQDAQPRLENSIAGYLIVDSTTLDGYKCEFCNKPLEVRIHALNKEQKQVIYCPNCKLILNIR